MDNIGRDYEYSPSNFFLSLQRACLVSRRITEVLHSTLGEAGTAPSAAKALGEIMNALATQQAEFVEAKQTRKLQTFSSIHDPLTDRPQNQTRFDNRWLLQPENIWNIDPWTSRAHMAPETVTATVSLTPENEQSGHSPTHLR